MIQTSIFDAVASHKRLVLDKVEADPAHFRKDFLPWLDDNWHLWLRFEEEANRTRRRGREHYAGRTIVEFIRHETMLAEVGGEFKINDHFTPDLCRLYMLLHRCPGFFETRVTKNAARAA